MGKFSQVCTCKVSFRPFAFASQRNKRYFFRFDVGLSKDTYAKNYYRKAHLHHREGEQARWNLYWEVKPSLLPLLQCSIILGHNVGSIFTW